MEIVFELENIYGSISHVPTKHAKADRKKVFWALSNSDRLR